MLDVTLSEEQEQATSSILKWISSPFGPHLTMGGYAGTGKTTVIKAILSRLHDMGKMAHVVAPTGKAVHVLTRKGVSARTIHNLIYKWDPDFKVFHLRERLESEASCIICDEASMVSYEVFRDLQTFNIPMVFIGDHGQLEPVGRNPKLMVDPMIKLETIHRQAQNSPIITFAHYLRNEGRAPDFFMNYPKFHGDPSLSLVPRKTFIPGEGSKAVVIVGTNRERCAYNRAYRRSRGPLPEEGEPLICLENNSTFGVWNGTTATCLNWDEAKSELTVLTDDGEILSMPADPNQFGSDKKPEFDRKRGVTFWDYAYALTCHKSQGSEWDEVVVLETTVPAKLWSLQRWQYTAATRAKAVLTYGFLRR